MNTGTKIAISAVGGFLVALMVFGAGHAVFALHGFGDSARGSMMSGNSIECPVQGQNDDGFRGGRMGGERLDSGCEGCPGGDVSGERPSRDNNAPGMGRP
jgi:hypothetical protein